MKMILDKLTHLPMFFRDDLTRLEPILARDWEGSIMKFDSPEDIDGMRKVYTKCNCKSMNFVWQQVTMEDHAVEVIACGECGNWSLEVTY